MNHPILFSDPTRQQVICLWEEVNEKYGQYDQHGNEQIREQKVEQIHEQKEKQINEQEQIQEQQIHTLQQHEQMGQTFKLKNSSIVSSLGKEYKMNKLIQFLGNDLERNLWKVHEDNVWKDHEENVWNDKDDQHESNQHEINQHESNHIRMLQNNHPLNKLVNHVQNQRGSVFQNNIQDKLQCNTQQDKIDYPMVELIIFIGSLQSGKRKWMRMLGDSLQNSKSCKLKERLKHVEHMDSLKSLGKNEEWDEQNAVEQELDKLGLKMNS